ncbi:MAG: M48 family metalloprotease [Euryarchaeota archaeon]|nr:M48 family metalloprotease [Euryarchaeota archaeon]
MLGLQLKMYLLVAAMFGIVYAVAVAATGGALGFAPYAIMASFMLFIQYMIGPKMVEWSMRIKYVSDKEAPELHRMVEELAQKAGLPKPKIGISPLPIPNAFAFGRWKSDGRVCVTEQIMRLLSKDELKAVLGHEISHLKHRDVTVITMLSVVPMILWYLSWNLMWARSGRDRGNAALLGIVAFVLYFITNLLVLYGSRIREHYADAGSVNLGSKPHHLASALYKLVYGSARVSKDVLKQVEGYKAFFASDPSRAFYEIQELKQLDTDLSGTLDQNELLALRSKSIRVGTSDKLMEIFSTHPNMLKRIKHLSEYH